MNGLRLTRRKIRGGRTWGGGALFGGWLGDGDRDGEALWHDLPVAGGTPGLFVVHVHCGEETREELGRYKGTRTRAGETNLFKQRRDGNGMEENTHECHKDGMEEGCVDGRREWTTTWVAARKGEEQGKDRLNI